VGLCARLHRRREVWMSTCAAGHLPPGELAARRRRRWHTLLGQKGGVDRPQQREAAGVGLRSLLRRRHEVSADAPIEEGARRCFEARCRRGAGAASTSCLGRMASWIAPNRGSPRRWASAPFSGDCASSQPPPPATPAVRFRFRLQDSKRWRPTKIQKISETACVRFVGHPWVCGT
jgi:hypothetical protein